MPKGVKKEVDVKALKDEVKEVKAELRLTQNAAKTVAKDNARLVTALGKIRVILDKLEESGTLDTAD